MIERLRIGSRSGGPDFRLSRIVRLQVDRRRDEIHALDALENKVFVFAGDGSFLRAWGGAGEGPGEFGVPMDLALGRDTAVVIDAAFVNVFSANGSKFIARFRPTTDLQVSAPIRVWATEDGWYVLMREVEPGVTGSFPHRRIYRLDLDARELGDRLVHVPRPASSDPLDHLPDAMVDELGRVIVVPGPGYTFRWVGGDSVHHEVEPVPYPEDVRRRHAAGLEEECGRSRAPGLCRARVADYLTDMRGATLPSRRPVIEALLGGRNGALLIARGDLDTTPHLRGDGVHYDLLNRDGSWAGSVELPDRFEPMWFDDVSIWGVHLDEFDVPFIVCLELERP